MPKLEHMASVRPMYLFRDKAIRTSSFTCYATFPCPGRLWDSLLLVQHHLGRNEGASAGAGNWSFELGATSLATVGRSISNAALDTVVARSRSSNCAKEGKR